MAKLTEENRQNVAQHNDTVDGLNEANRLAHATLSEGHANTVTTLTQEKELMRDNLNQEKESLRK